MLKRIAASIVIATGVVLCLTGCGPDHGTVIAKDHSSASTYLQCIPKSTGGCTFIPQTRPESWSVKLKLGDEQGWTTVSEEIYDKASVGEPLDLRKR